MPISNRLRDRVDRPKYEKPKSPEPYRQEDGKDDRRPRFQSTLFGIDLPQYLLLQIVV